MEGLFLPPSHDALFYLISTLWCNEIKFMLLACRYRSLNPYLGADKFKDLTYVKQSLLLSQLGTGMRGWGRPGYLFLKPYVNLLLSRRSMLYYSLMNWRSLQGRPRLASYQTQSQGHSQLMYFIGSTGLVSPSNHPLNCPEMCSLGRVLS